jgi:hypothetical protein
LEKHLTRYIKGMTLEAKEDCMNNFRKNQIVEVTVDEDENHNVLIDDIVMLDANVLRKYFRIVRGEG